MVKQFITKLNIDDKVIIGKGARQSLFACNITSTPYYEENEQNSYKTRRRIKNLKRIPEEFTRPYLQQTIRYYK